MVSLGFLWFQDMTELSYSPSIIFSFICLRNIFFYSASFVSTSVYALKIHQELSERGQIFSADKVEKMNVSLRRFQVTDLEEEL